MTSSVRSLPGKTPYTFLVVLTTSAFSLAMIGGVALAATPFVSPRPAAMPATSTPLSWAAVDIAKPTYTPSPTPSPMPTFTPTMPPTPTALPTQAPTMQVASQANEVGKVVLVSISEQHLYAYDNGQLVYSFIASTGEGNSTRIGNFSVLDKIPNAYGATWNIWMPDWLGIYYSGTLENGIHALPILPSGDRLWSGYLGTPISFGCVVLGTDEALQLYNWVDIGTPVQIVW